jgi:peptidoglycan/LPS O-acetylase OafA/YrhL
MLPYWAKSLFVPTASMMDGRQNCFDEIRLIGALMVIVGHGYVLTGQVAPNIFGHPIHSVGVKIFFVVSGYLITLSWQRDPDTLRYLIRRSLRIFPALAACVIFTALIIGPLYTSLSAKDYFAHPVFRFYFWNIGLRPVFALPGVFADNPFSTAVNGSLWTLPVEFAAYLLTPFFLTLSRVRVLGPIFLMGMIILWLRLDWAGQVMPPDQIQTWVFYDTNIFYAANRISYYWVGAIIASLSLQRWLRLDVMCGLVAAALLYQSLSEPTRLRSFVLPLLVFPYVTLAIAMRLKALPSLNWIVRRGDYSYGLYLYAFPVQQAMIASFGIGWLANPVLHTVSVTAITLILAILSWHGIEKTALRLKPRRR